MALALPSENVPESSSQDNKLTQSLPVDIDDGMPDATEVVQAFVQVRKWVDTMTMPKLDDEESSLMIDGGTGVLIQLRQGGRRVGRGSNTRKDALMVRRAAGSAMSDLLSEPGMQSMPDDLRRSVGPQLTLELEVAGRLTPIVAQTFEDVARQLRPGIDGIALRQGSEWVYRFPSQLLDHNLQTYLLGLLSELDIMHRRRPLSQIKDEEGLSLYQFEATHLAQSSPSSPPFPLFRGSTIVSSREVDQQSLQQTAANIANHLIVSEWQKLIEQDGQMVEVEEPLGIGGWYLPHADRYEPLIASPFEQALSSYALSYFARTPGVDQIAARDAARFGNDLIDELAEHMEGNEPDPLADLDACAMIILAAYQLTSSPTDAVGELVNQASAKIWNSFDPEQRNFMMFDEDNSPVAVPGRTQALIAAALARTLAIDPARIDAATVRTMLDTVWESTAATDYLGLLPWIGWAELDYASAMGSMAPAALENLDKLSQLLDASQVSSATADAQPDEIGGYQLAGPFGTAPTSQGLRPAAWRARALVTDSNISDMDSLAVELGKQLDFGRFVMQLSVRDEDLWAMRNAKRAHGGIRESLSESRQPIPAQGLALVTICDILRGIERLDGLVSN